MPKNNRDQFPTVTWVDPRELKVDSEYQRARREPHVRRIVENWNPLIFRPPLVAERNGEMWVVNGQHGVEAAIRLGIPEIPVILTKTASVAEDADLFGRVNSADRRLSACERHKARVVAGDAKAVEIQWAIDNTGWKLKDGTNLSCITALETVYDRYGITNLRRVLETLRRCSFAKAGQAWTVEGLGLYFCRWPDADDERTYRTLEAHAVEVERETCTGGYGKDGGGRFARTLATLYNKRLAPKNRLPIE
jgi:hypothetical protein